MGNADQLKISFFVRDNLVTPACVSVLQAYFYFRKRFIICIHHLPVDVVFPVLAETGCSKNQAEEK